MPSFPPLLAALLDLGLNLVPIAILVWCTAVGGVVGSFLNVVIYRLPAGENIAYPSSRCPRCLNAIRWYDNVPVLSWLILRAQCRDCGQPISIRYPIIESIVAAIFFTLAYLEWIGGGENLPNRALDGAAQPAALSLAMLAGISLFHAILLVTLLAATMMEWDGHLPPGSLFLPGLAMALFAPFIWPELRPLPWSAHGTEWQARWLDPLPALAAGMLAAWITWPARLYRDRRIDGSWATNGDWWLVGLALGWQATLFVAAAAALLHLAWTLLQRAIRALPNVPFALWMVASVLTLLLLWREIAARTGGALSYETLAWASGAILTALAASWGANALAMEPADEPTAKPKLSLPELAAPTPASIPSAE